MLNVPLNIDPIVWKRSPLCERPDEAEGRHIGSSTALTEPSTGVQDRGPSVTTAGSPGEDPTDPIHNA